MSFEPFGGWAGVPAIGVAGALDDLPDDDQRGGEVEVEVHDLGVAVGHAAELAVAVHPGVGAFHRPAPPGLDRGGDAQAGDLVGEAELGEQLAGGPAVIAGGPGAGALAGQGAPQPADRPAPGGGPPWRVGAVCAPGGRPPRGPPPMTAQNSTQAGSSSDDGTTGTGHLDDHGLW